MQAIGRWGNYFNQELYGPPTTLPWGIPIDCAHRLADVPVRAVPGGHDALPPAVPVRVDLGARSGRRSSSGSGSAMRVAPSAGRPVPGLPDLVRDDPLRPRDLRERQLDVLRDPGRPDLLGRRDPGRGAGPRLSAPPRGTRPIDPPRTRRWPVGRARRGMDDPADRRAVGECPRHAAGGRRGRGGRCDRLGRDHRRGRRRGRRRATTMPTSASMPTTTRGPTRMTEPVHPADGADETTPDPATPTTGRRRPPPGRVAPEAMAAARGGVTEGLAWLGRPPEAKASLLYRAVRLLVRFLCFGVFRFRIATSGQDHVPPGGYLLVAGAHRGWMDPFVVMHALPVEPRCWILGSGPSDLHVALAGVVRQADRGPAAGLARRGRDRPARRLRQGRARQRRGVRPDAGGHGERAARSARRDADRLGDHRDAHRAPRSCRWRWPAPRSCISGGGWRRGSSRRRRSATLAGLAPDAPLPAEGTREELDLARVMTDRLATILGPASRRCTPRRSTRPTIRVGCASV